MPERFEIYIVYKRPLEGIKEKERKRIYIAPLKGTI